MNLPNLFVAQKDQTEPYLVLCLLLSQTKVQALLLSIEQTKTVVKSQSNVFEYTDTANCVLKTDEALQDLGPESETVNQVIFGLEPDWVTEGDVADAHKPLIKKITTDLALEAVGFVVTSEALVHYLLQQNAMFSGIILLLGAQSITANFLAQGNLKAAVTVGRSTDISADLAEALARFKSKLEDGTYLPGKLILSSFELSEEDLRSSQQQLLNYNWDTIKIFLQTPVVDVLSTEVYTEVLAHEAARAAALSQGMQVQIPTKPQTAEPTTTSLITETKGATTMVADTEPSDEDDNLEDASTEFGFAPVAGTESTDTILTSEKKSEPADDSTAQDQVEEAEVLTAEPAVTTKSTKNATSFGVPISPDKLYPEPDPILTANNKDDDSTSHEPSQLTSSSFFAKLKAAWHTPYKGNRSRRFFIVAGVGFGLLAVVLISLASLWVMATATVSVKLKTVPVSKEVVITLDPDVQASDPENLVLAVDTVTKEVSGDKTVATTGVKIVGDPAKGKVTLLNKTESLKTFAAGTVLANNELQFALDEEVTVASASVKETTSKESVTTYGEAEASVTALQIGPESNLAKDTELTVADFATNTYSALVVEELTGGASREVRVVSEEDQADGLAELRQELIERANEELAGQAGAGTYILPTSEIVNEEVTYSDEVETEADEMIISLALTVNGLSYTAQDLQPIATSVLASEIEEGYELTVDDPQILSAPSEERTDERISLEANITSQARPVLTESEIQGLVQGKSVSEAENELSSHEKITSTEVIIKPPIAGWLIKTVPNNPEKITITFTQ